MPKTLVEIEPLTRKAIERFIAEMLARQNENVVKIVLFGSVARGDDNKDSDIDVFVLLKNSDLGEDLIRSSVVADEENDYETYLAPLSMSLKEYSENERIGSPIIKNIKREGIILYESTDSDKIINEATSQNVEKDDGTTIIGLSMKRALVSLLSSENDILCSDARVDRAHHSAACCATAVFLSKGMEVNSLKKILDEFYEKLVTTGEFPEEFGDYLMELQNGRFLADETLYMHTAEEAEQLCRKARLFYEAVLENFSKEKIKIMDGRV